MNAELEIHDKTQSQKWSKVSKSKGFKVRSLCKLLKASKIRHGWPVAVTNGQVILISAYTTNTEDESNT